jgi:hypothetical protein
MLSVSPAWLKDQVAAVDLTPVSPSRLETSDGQIEPQSFLVISPRYSVSRFPHRLRCGENEALTGGHAPSRPLAFDVSRPPGLSACNRGMW